MGILSDQVRALQILGKGVEDARDTLEPLGLDQGWTGRLDRRGWDVGGKLHAGYTHGKLAGVHMGARFL